MMDIQDYPKIELHVHLDCSISFEAASQLDPTLDKTTYLDTFIVPPKSKGLVDYIQRAQRGIALMQTREGLEVVTMDLARQLLADHIRYAEIRFAPLEHLREGLTPEAVVQTVTEALARFEQKHPIHFGLLLCTLRHYSEAQSLETAALVDRFRDQGVVGLDIAADEVNFGVEAHIAAFQYAKDHGLHCTAHAGEGRGADSVWETLQYFQPTRIGHGVRSTEDPELIAHLVSKKIHLEVCPTSNIQTDIYATYADHKVDWLYKHGLSIGINTDGRTLSNVTLTEEYRRLQEHFGWGAAEFLQCNLNALEAAFLSDTEKKALKAELLAAYS
jgi:adenosine deaminase